MIKRLLILALITVPVALFGQVTTIGEQFNSTTFPPTDWNQSNTSSPIGADTNWTRGYPANANPSGLFEAKSPDALSFASANFNNIDGAGDISNWLLTPFVTANNGDSLQFWTRTTSFGGTYYPDRLQVRWANSNSSNVGNSAATVGDFSTLLLDINPAYSVEDQPTGYPHAWTKITIIVTGLAASGESGRFAFRYFVEDGGPTGANSAVIGIDDVSFPNNVIASVKEIDKSLSFGIAPNPVSEHLTVNGLTGKSHIKIFSIDGKVVAERMTSADVETFNLEFLSAGSYTVQVSSGNKITAKRIVVQ